MLLAQSLGQKKSMGEMSKEDLWGVITVMGLGM